MRLLPILLAVLPLAAQTVYYSKSFPGSVPAYVSVEVQKDGTAVYKESPEDENPIDFKMPPAETQEIFALAEKLDRFKRQLESGLNVAKMGEKTFRFVDATGKNEVKFNYSLDLDAKALLDLFERVSETQMLLFELEKTVRFDKLGVNKSLLQIESAWDRKRLVGAERFLPMLDRVAKNGSYLNMARERAGALAETFRTPPPATSSESK